MREGDSRWRKIVKGRRVGENGREKSFHSVLRLGAAVMMKIRLSTALSQAFLLFTYFFCQYHPISECRVKNSYLVEKRKLESLTLRRCYNTIEDGIAAFWLICLVVYVQRK